MSCTFEFDKSQPVQRITRNIFEYLQHFAINLETLINNTDSYKEPTLGKNVLYSSTALIESFINSLLMSNKRFHKQTLEKIERWPLADKCDFLYSIQKHKPLDRNILQPILNFLRIRNVKTHPKPKEQLVMSVIEENELFSFKTNQQELSLHKEKGIKLGK